MAGADKEEFPPLLPAGFHDLGLEGIRRLCVERFPLSVTRPRIMANLEALIAVLQQNGMRGDVWVDGSFLTEKLNPDDVDLVLVVTPQTLFAMDVNQRNFFDWFRTTNLYDQYKCDNYALVLDKTVTLGEYMYAYWLRQFGFSRADEMKGLAVVKLPFLVTP